MHKIKINYYKIKIIFYAKKSTNKRIFCGVRALKENYFVPNSLSPASPKPGTI